MSNLSPAARAVRDAFLTAPMGHSHVDDDQYGIAAALRAAADQVVPEEKVTDYVSGGPQAFALQRRATRRQILAIAVELEGES